MGERPFFMLLTQDGFSLGIVWVLLNALRAKDIDLTIHTGCCPRQAPEIEGMSDDRAILAGSGDGVREL
jgi:hypothetical protein